MQERMHVPEGLPIFHTDQLKGALDTLDSIRDYARTHGVNVPVVAGVRSGYIVNKNAFPQMKDENGDLYQCERFFSPETADYLGFNASYAQMPDSEMDTKTKIEKMYFFKRPFDTWAVQADIYTIRTDHHNPDDIPTRSEELLKKYFELLQASH